MSVFRFWVFGILVGTTVMASPYYRFWRGWKLGTLSAEKFQQGLNEKFVGLTVEVGKGQGLLAYLPALLPKAEDRPSPLAKKLPDEIALVVYDSEDHYKRIRSTPNGIAYGKMHWDYFNKNGSASLVPGPYLGRLEFNHAYDVLQSSANWQKGRAVFYVSKIRKDPSEYVNSMKKEIGLLSYLILVSEDLFFEYQLWNKEQSQLLDEDGGQLQNPYLERIKGAFGPMEQRSPRDPHLAFGEGINVSF